MYSAMFVQVGIFVLFAASFTNGDYTPCSTELQQCTDAFTIAKYDDWKALVTYSDCIDGVTCLDEDAAGKDMKTSLQTDVENRKMYWGREWNVMDTAPLHVSALVVITISAIVALRLSSY